MENRKPSLSEIEMEDNWMTEMNKHMEADIEGEMWWAEERQQRRDFDSERSIYKVPKLLKDANSDAYMPKLVSLGPYHHDRPHLRHMEKHKTRACFLYLRRNTVTPEEVMMAMRNVKNGLIRAYDGLDINLAVEDAAEPWLRDEEKFLQIMIVDGCFALDVILSGKKVRHPDHEFALRWLFGSHKMLGFFPHDFKRDMLLMENQLPLLALYTLARFERSEEICRDLNNIIADFFGVSFSENNERSCRHILDLYRKCRIAHGNYLPGLKENLHPATELSYAGISFHLSKTTSFTDISIFHRVLQLPVLEIDDDTKSLLLNLICFERMLPGTENEVSAYVFFMKSIIYTIEDVALLRKKSIIKGWLGYDDKIVNMFNQIIKEHTLRLTEDYWFMNDVSRTLNDHCKKVLIKFRINSMRTFWKDPISFSTFWLGVVIIFILTLIQTIFAVLSYKQAQHDH